MKCDHCGVKRFVLNICAFCSSDKLSSPNSKVSISKLLRNCRLFVNCSRASTYKQHSKKSESHPLLPIHRHQSLLDIKNNEQKQCATDKD